MKPETLCPTAIARKRRTCPKQIEMGRHGQRRNELNRKITIWKNNKANVWCRNNHEN
jgi:hypothetical protein